MSAKKFSRIQGQEIVAKAENTFFSTPIANADNVEDAIDNIDGRVATLELGGSGSSGSYSSPFAGKEFALIGDSFSAPDKWFQVMCNALGATKGKNAAVSGGTWKRRLTDGKSAYWQAVQIKNYYDNNGGAPDYILCVLGTNDAYNMWGSGNKLGYIDYGDVRFRVRNLSNQEVTEYGYWVYGTNEPVLDENNHTIFTKYNRNTSSRIGNGTTRTRSDISPINYIYDAECDSSIADVNSPSSPMTDKLDTNYITGGMQATILYLRYYFPNATIVIGFTPAGLIHSGYVKGVVQGYTVEDFESGLYNYEYIIGRLKQLADLYGVRYINTLQCGICPWSEGTAKYSSGSHPTNVPNSTDDGQTVIGLAMAKIMMGNP